MHAYIVRPDGEALSVQDYVRTHPEANDSPQGSI